ncbi:hypothetical protein AB0C34_06190 [Nocardia sp. NPDC049220]
MVQRERHLSNINAEADGRTTPVAIEQHSVCDQQLAGPGGRSQP